MAIILPLFLLLVLGVLDFGRAINYYNDATQLANAGARAAAVNGTLPQGSPTGTCTPGGGSLQELIRSQADTCEMWSNSAVHICFPTNPDTNTSGQVGDPVQVNVDTTFNWLPFFTNKLSFSTITMHGKAVMRLEQPPAGIGANPPCS